MLPYNDNEEQPEISNFISDPSKLSIRHSHERTICDNPKDGNNVKNMLPYPNASRFLGKWPPPYPAQLICVESHAQKMIKKAD
mmetsp:Transcript_23274/g.42010  ORF Transcript_23274/g.42010 Transcript_23274/m.42010 type:complete len:83 (+) Transcript_23274:287-535(+)